MCHRSLRSLSTGSGGRAALDDVFPGLAKYWQAGAEFTRRSDDWGMWSWLLQRWVGVMKVADVAAVAA
jgi:hypothetical protein